MSRIGRMTFRTVVEVEAGFKALSLELDVTCVMHCDSSDDGPYAEDFEIRNVEGGEWSEHLVERAVDALSLELEAVEHFMAIAPTRGDVPKGIYERVTEFGYRERIDVHGVGKVEGACEWYVSATRVLPYGRGTTIVLYPLEEFLSIGDGPPSWERVESDG